ncbi:MAG: hypothetical protein BroJett040_20830 [Oligoflexia bacterium]|nr:MAG: hypothetical protein BroJett040_20830 [Oligoflexia bacterium]
MKTTMGTQKITAVIFALTLMTSLVGCNQEDQANTNLASQIETASLDETLDKSVSLEDATYEHIAALVTQCHGRHLCIPICHRPAGNPTKGRTLILPLSATRGHLNHNHHSAGEDDREACNSRSDNDDGHHEMENDGRDDDRGHRQHNRHHAHHKNDAHDERDYIGPCRAEDDAGSIDTGDGDDDGDTDTVVDTGVTPVDPVITDTTNPTPNDPGSVTDTTTPPTTDVSTTTITDNGAITDPTQVPIWCQPFYSVDQDCDGYNDTTGVSWLQ